MKKSEQPTLKHATRGWQGGFWSLIATQFQTAFNDNAVKFLVIYIIVAMNFPNQFRDRLILLVGALFALPFIFFSMTGGYFADRYSKRSVTIGTKLLELGVMAFTITGPIPPQLADGVRVCFPHQHGSSSLRPLEVRLAAGAASGEPAFLGQWHHRTRNVCG
jgi:MFS family permease